MHTSTNLRDLNEFQVTFYHILIKHVLHLDFNLSGK